MVSYILLIILVMLVISIIATVVSDESISISEKIMLSLLVLVIFGVVILLYNILFAYFDGALVQGRENGNPERFSFGGAVSFLCLIIGIPTYFVFSLLIKMSAKKYLKSNVKGDDNEATK